MPLVKVHWQIRVFLFHAKDAKNTKNAKGEGSKFKV